MTKVRALKTRKQINDVGDLLNKHYGRHFLQMWRFAVNVGLRMGDVLSISMEQAKKGLKDGHIEIKEQKKKKYNRFDLNIVAKQIIEERVKENKTDLWLFQSHGNNAKAMEKPISRNAVYLALREVGQIYGVKLGTHSARKSRARLMYESGETLESIASVLNHDDIKDTIKYIDITQDEKDRTYHEYVI